jgi:hypothetical protein
VLTTSADAGHRGHFHFHHFHFSPFIRPLEPVYVPRRRRIVKPTVRAAKPARRRATVKYSDREGRRYDLACKTWFDGAASCWKGRKSFVFRSSAWFYGNARWVKTNNGWGVSSGDPPARVDCAGIKAFAGKVKPVSTASEAAPAESPKQSVAKPAPVRTVAPAPAAGSTKALEATASANGCQKYLPSLGEAVSVPCT